MARLVYLPEIAKDTYLHLSVLGATVRLRDFSKSDREAPNPFSPPDLTPDRLEELANQHPNCHLTNEPAGQPDPGVSGTEAVGIWHRRILELNRTLMPVDSEERAKRLDLEAKTHDAASARWRKYKVAISVVAALAGLMGAIVALWK